MPPVVHTVTVVERICAAPGCDVDLNAIGKGPRAETCGSVCRLRLKRARDATQSPAPILNTHVTTSAELEARASAAIGAQHATEDAARAKSAQAQVAIASYATRLHETWQTAARLTEKAERDGDLKVALQGVTARCKVLDIELRAVELIAAQAADAGASVAFQRLLAGLMDDMNEVGITSDQRAQLAARLSVRGDFTGGAR